MATIDDIMAWDWPEDCNEQGAAFHQLQVMLDTLFTEWDALTPPLLQLNQGSSPSSADWQSFWLRQGNELPIPENARMLWFNDEEGTFAGEWTILDGLIVRKENRFYKGRTDLVPFMPVTNDYTSPLDPITTLSSIRTPTSITLGHAAKLHIRMDIGIEIPSGAAGGIIAYQEMKLAYRINGVVQIVDPIPANAGLFAAGVTHPSNAVNDVTQSEIIWLHPTILQPDVYLINFQIAEATSYSGNFFHVNPTLLPTIGAISSGYYFVPAYVWEITYE